MGELRPVRIGIVGTGRIASSYFEAARSLPGLNLVAVADSHQSKAETLAREYGFQSIDIYEDASPLFESNKAEAVCICTPHHTHAALAIQALRRGMHVLVEKPVCLQRAEYEKLRDAVSTSTELIFGVAHQNRHTPLAKAIKKVVQEELGDLCHVQLELACNRTADYYINSTWKGRWMTEGGSVLINQGIHLLDFVLWILGRPSVAIGWWKNRYKLEIIETEDSLAGILEFDSGVTATVSMTSNASVAFRPQALFRGRSGHLRVDLGFTHRVLEFDGPDSARLLLDTATHRPLASFASKDTPTFRTSHFELLDDFVGCCRGEVRALTNLREAYLAVQVVQALYQSGREGNRPVDMAFSGID